LGMEDTISEEDLFIDSTKTEVEKEQVKLGKENEILKEQIKGIVGQMEEIKGQVNELFTNLIPYRNTNSVWRISNRGHN